LAQEAVQPWHREGMAAAEKTYPAVATMNQYHSDIEMLDV
jgi:hypothetical protein